MLRYIWAQDKNGVIGYKNDLPWQLPADLRYFKEQTVGKTIIMGRKTYEAVGRPLPNRVNIVLTTDTNFKADGIVVMHTKAEVLEYAKQADHPIMITGGSSIFELFKEDVDELYVTLIDETFPGDTYIPSFDWENYQLVSDVEGAVDEKNIYHHQYQIYRKK